MRCGFVVVIMDLFLKMAVPRASNANLLHQLQCTNLVAAAPELNTKPRMEERLNEYSPIYYYKLLKSGRNPTLIKMLASDRQRSIRRNGIEKMEDDKLRTIDCLRGRLLAERVASKAAKEEADKLAKRLQELERKLAAEIKCRDKAEKKLKLAMKKLESVKVLGGKDQMDMPLSSVSSSSSQCFSGHQVFDEMSGSMTVDLGQCDPREDVQRVKSSLGSDDLLRDDHTSGSSQGESAHQLVSLVRSWTSTGTAKSQYRETPKGIEEDEGFSPKEWAIGDLRACSSSSDRQETSEKESYSEENMLALVPISQPQDLEVGKAEIKDNVQGVLLALRNVKEQLLHSLRMRADICSSRDFFADHRDSHQSPFCCRTSY
ncbi:hypothetical protein Cni_G25052 [Canna indica]|uniref:Uncharacterized protein n=1 Tax=Canna indica TaxID=4628 RepID=A0AAQ3KX99_9LILI|nr:hypothetical protein Cni_G25052 [Canna indica]